ncbi:cell division protein FtsQ/DivIB [Lapidilactobacillus wuchangensis]|uniref:cell division protein FtsQ/DivIB n=1 Tax=Lapidilactobacillus wuchangensis TaxID=2486001 RepID=UPI000F791118|nr:cell division protein FtsQ/DivIB [Lapidilactobacillus wuchangensis]
MVKKKATTKVAQQDPNSTIQVWESFQKRFQSKQARAHKRPVTRKLPQLQKHRRWQLTWHLLVIVLIFGNLLVGLLYYVSPMAHVGELSVTGVKITAAQDVINASELSSKSYVLPTMLHQKKIEQKMRQQIPALKKVTIKFSQWNHGRIDVVEQQTVGFFAKKNGYQRIFSNGAVDKAIHSKPIGNFPVYAGFKSGKTLNQVVELYAKMPNQIQNAISEIKADPSKSNPYRIHLYMNDGNEVLADSRTVISRLKYYGNIVSQTQEKGVVDLEVGAFFVPFAKQ